MVNKKSLIMIIIFLEMNFDVKPAKIDPKKAPSRVNETHNDF